MYRQKERERERLEKRYGKAREKDGKRYMGKKAESQLERKRERQREKGRHIDTEKGIGREREREKLTLIHKIYIKEPPTSE